MLLQGQRFVVTGIASKLSIAWSIAEALHREGATLILTYPNDKIKKRVDMAAEKFEADLEPERDDGKSRADPSKVQCGFPSGAGYRRQGILGESVGADDDQHLDRRDLRQWKKRFIACPRRCAGAVLAPGQRLFHPDRPQARHVHRHEKYELYR